MSRPNVVRGPIRSAAGTITGYFRFTVVSPTQNHLPKCPANLVCIRERALTHALFHTEKVMVRGAAHIRSVMAAMSGQAFAYPVQLRVFRGTFVRPLSVHISTRTTFPLWKTLNSKRQVQWPTSLYSTVAPNLSTKDGETVNAVDVEAHEKTAVVVAPLVQDATPKAAVQGNGVAHEQLCGEDLEAQMHASVSELSEASSESKLSEDESEKVAPVKGMGPPTTHYRLSPVTVELLEKNGITHVTEVQAGTFDLLYDGKDVIAKSRTGTGKTLAFALPILERLALKKKEHGPLRRGQGPGCIVLAPTRELAKQVAREMSYIGKGLGLSVECFYGGSSYAPQESALKRGFDVLVGTPGRIIDHLDRGTLRLDNISFAVLDEADEMLSMGFADDVETIFRTLPPVEARQVILFSATVPRWVKQLAAQYQKPGVEMFDSVTSGPMAATTVRHCAVRVPERDESRAALLADIIAVHSRMGTDVDHSSGPSRAIVFTQTKREADDLATCGALDGCGAAVLHGDVGQRQRESTLAQFRSGRFQVLVATDVAARGLDISGVDVVVQYRVPRDSDAYIHRAGRTGRAGRSGTAVVMYDDRELRSLRGLELDCRIKFERESAPAPEMALEAAVDFAVETSKTVDDRILKHLLPKAQEILDSPETAASTLAGILAVAGRRTKLEDRSVLSGESGMRTILLQGDRPVTPGVALRFIGELARHVGTSDQVGLIRVCRDGQAVVDVPSFAADQLLEAAEQLAKLGKGRSYLKLTAATEVPPLREDDTRRGGRFRDRDRDRDRSRDRGRDRDRDRRGRGGPGGRGSYSSGRSGYHGRRESNEWSREGERRGRDNWSRGRGSWQDYRGRDGGNDFQGRSGSARRDRRPTEFLDDDF